MSGTLCLRNAASRLRAKTELGLCADGEAAFIAGHFYELDFDAISSVSLEEVDAVLDQDSLVLESESALLDALLGLGDAARASGVSCGFERLVRHVRPQHLDAANLEAYAERTRGFCPDVFDAIIGGLRAWLESCGWHLRPDGDRRFVSRDPECALHEGDPFNGVLAHLRSRCGGNVHTTRTVDVTASNTQGIRRCEQVTDHGWNNWWFSTNSSGSWLQLDFKERAVRPTGYSLMSDGDGREHQVK